MSDLELRVAKLEAAKQIRSLKASYASGCDKNYSPDELAPLFTEDAVWVDPSGTFGKHEGREAIRAFFVGVSATLIWARHYVINPVIDVADDLTTASGTWYLWQTCTIDNEAVWIIGAYKDEYRREDGVWLISRCELTLDAITPFDRGWVEQQFLAS
jgi:uncharacterized protein (TIGR02246 family)